MKAATAYLESTNEGRAKRRRYAQELDDDEEEEEEEEIRIRELDIRRREKERRVKEKREREKKEGKKNGNEAEEDDKKKKKEMAIVAKENMSLMTKSVATIAGLTLSLYSAHRASLSWGDITFHSQLELLTTHVNAALESTSAWIKDRQDMSDIVPDILARDVTRLKELLSLIERLDSRTEKRLETAGWGISTAGSLSVLGGVALGWTDQALFLSGAAMVGGILFGVINRNRWNGPSWKASKAILEARLTTIVRELQQDASIREHVMQELEQKVRKPDLYFSNTTLEEPNLEIDLQNVKVELDQAGRPTTRNNNHRMKEPVPSA